VQIRSPSAALLWCRSHRWVLLENRPLFLLDLLRIANGFCTGQMMVESRIMKKTLLIVVGPALLWTSLSFGFFPSHGPLVGAHRGGGFELCGNMIPAFEKTAKTGVDIIEFDLRASADGVPFVLHDPKLQSSTRCRGAISEKNSADLIGACKCKVGSAVMPSFEEVLLWNQSRNRPVILNAEFKDLAAIEPAIELVQKYQAYDTVYFQTKADPQRYQIARERDSKVKLLFAPKDDAALDWALALVDPDLRVIELHENIRTPENIERIRKAGKLSSENSWHFTSTREVFGATCTDVFRLKIDIAITNRAKQCLKQRLEATWPLAALSIE